MLSGVLEAQTYLPQLIAGVGTSGYLGDGAPATTALVNNPKCIALDGAGNVYISDYSNQRVRKVNTSGIISTIAGTGTSGYSGDGGPATSANISNPWGIATDDSGNVFFSTGTTVREINTSGIISTVAGTGTTGYTGDGGPATSATLNGAAGIAIDGYGDIYIAETGNNCIRKVNTSGVISTIAGTGTAGYTGDGGPATIAALDSPKAIALDGFGNIYIASSGARVRKINAFGIISTFAGNGTVGFTGDGSAATGAHLSNTISSICTDNAGNVYINDSARIRKINLSGIIGTLTGTGIAGYSTSACSFSVFSDNYITAANGTIYISTDAGQRIFELVNNSTPRFLAGHTQSFAVCTGSGANSLNTALAIIDSDAGQSETWSIVTGPSHGTLVGFCSGTSTGGATSPTGLYYSPSGSYLGPDIFKMKVTDCLGYTDTTRVYVDIINSFSAITMPGPTNVCLGSTVSLWDTLGGGVWSSASPSIASIGSSYGNVTALTLGTTLINYSLNLSCGSATTTTTVNVVLAPAAISGTAVACAGGGTATVSDSSIGGNWYSGNTAIATIGSATGVLTGVSAGSVIVTYSLPSGCLVTRMATVNPLPAVPVSSGSGGLNICIGSSVVLLDSLSGGTWHPANADASVGVITGIVTGISTGTDVINYVLPSGCSRAATVTINPTPSAISGAVNVCAGSSILLTDTTAGGVWSSSNTLVATVGSASGLVTGIASGVVNISYTNSSGCPAIATITVNALHAITGAPILCGAPITLTDSTAGGVWTTTSTVVSIGTLSGIVTPLSLGTALITYTMPTGCVAMKSVTVNTPPSVIVGVAALCAGTTGIFGDSTLAGSWSSSSIAIGAIGSLTGILRGVAPGVDTISYTLTSGCAVSKQVTVTAAPSLITALPSLCMGSTLITTDSISGGYWSTTGSGVIIGSGSGIVTGLSPGVDTIAYTLYTGCAVAKTVTVNALPSLISGSVPVCVGSSLMLGDSVTGGTWSSGGGSISIGSATGVVAGLSAAVNMVTYTLPSGCFRTVAITVNPLPGAIIGISSSGICPGQTETLSDGTGGVWTSSSSAIATIGSTGILTGVAGGVAEISYTLPTGCRVISPAMVNAAAGPITGVTSVCLYLSSTLADSSRGGAWLSSDYSIADPDTGGVVTGYGVGTATISYINRSGCMAVATFTVNPVPGIIYGIFSFCAGGTTTLINSVGGGTWSSSDTTKVRVNPSTGLLTGVAPGSATITYTMGAGCSVSQTVTILPPPTVITGVLQVCRGNTTTLFDGTSGGVWSSTGSAVTIGSAGSLSSCTATGVSTGTAVISYTTGPGCAATAVVTVNPMPAAITGAGSVCVGSTTTLTDAGGTWSAIGSAASVGSGSGVVTGISSGTVTVVYTLPTGCATSKTITVNALPSAISGPSSVCVGQTITETDGGGGTWSRTGSTISIGSSSGVVTGITAGTCFITYTLPLTGCIATKEVTVNTSPGTISGTLNVCIGAATYLSDAGVGLWSSSSSAVTVGSGTGVVTGVSAGVAIVTYAIGSTGTLPGCLATTALTVNPLPALIGGAGSICPGRSLTLTESGSGLWSPATGTVAYVGTGSGIVTAVSGGVAAITYTFPATGCYRTTTVTVYPTPDPIGGPSAVCVGAHIDLTESGAGTWTTGSAGVATIGSGTGIVTGVATGTGIITFTTGTGCNVTTTVTVSTSPTAITGPYTLCQGASVALTDTIGGGIWNSGGAATIGSLSGIVTGLSVGTAPITYSLGTGCTVMRTETVIPLPAAIGGSSVLYTGIAATLTDATTGGVWSTTSTAVAVGSAGIVTGIAADTATIYYTLPTGCTVSIVVTVDPSVAVIRGPASVCQGAAITETDSISGGTWTTTSLLITIGSSTGVVTGVSAGTAVITYTLGGSMATRSITVNAISPITGPTIFCAGSAITLTDAIPGGLWGSVSVPVTVGSRSGVVTGWSAGAATITYTSATGCTAVYTVTVNAAPMPVGGVLQVCVGSATTLADATVGGVWSTAGGSITIVGSSGVVAGIAAGTAPVTYTLATGCASVNTVTVNSLPAVPSGSMSVCPGTTTILTDAAAGGTWGSSSSTITVGSATGLITGISAGPATVSYTSAVGCVSTFAMTVNPLPANITGVFTVCEGATTILSDDTTGGVWWAAVSSTASVGSATGVVTGISAGTGIITYTLPTGCATTASVYVHSSPRPITGATAMCLYSGITLSDGLPGGMWSTPTGAAVTVGSSTGIVTGTSIGVAMVSYTISGCTVTTVVSVTALPPNIVGTDHFCVGLTDTLIDAGGGIWTSSNPLIATVGSANGAVFGLIPGTLSITYSLGLRCSVTMPVTVSASPASITGPSVLCAGNTVTLHDITAGGVWSSGATSLATVGASGVVHGIAGGTADMSYTSADGCSSVYPVAVIQVPAITGTHNICAWGDTMTVYDPLPAGSFTSTLVTVSDSGAVLSYAPGTAVITYTESHGCFATATITVNPLPGEITGSRDICVGATAVLSDTSIGGIWSLAPTLAGTISPTGVVAGIATGEVAVTYTTSRYGCSQSMTVTVDAAPMSAGTITGSSNVCAGSSITLSNATTGGAWSAAGAVAIGSATGVVAAASAGTAAISYTISNHCGSIATTKTVTVNADVTPTINISTPTDTLCAGSLAHFASVITNGGATPAYVWIVNGGATTATASSYSYTPANGDAVTAMLTSNEQCAVPASVTSNTVTMTVNPQVIPVVVITATPPGTILTGAAKTLTATVSNGGDNPTYQWVLNGVVIPGAIDSSYTATTFNDGDTVTCVVISSGVCGGNTAFSNKEGIVVYNNVGIKSLAPKEELAVYPNPNNGAFTIKGAIGNTDEEVNIVVTDLLGQEVYRTSAVAQKGLLSAEVQLTKSVANGMYLVSINTTEGVRVFHMAVAQ
jgi:uncharacterized protein YjdB